MRTHAERLFTISLTKVNVELWNFHPGGDADLSRARLQSPGYKTTPARRE
jgi:hypothetical protein